MAKKKLEIEEEVEIDEASSVAGVKGFQMPIGAKGKKKNNPSKPYGEPELYERRVEKRANGWVVIDPRDGSEHGPAASRDAARELQRSLGITVPKGQQGPGDQPKANKARTLKPESVKRLLKKLKESGKDPSALLERSMISFIFKEENKPSWNTFLEKLSRNMVESDQGLNETLRFMAQTEAKTLARSVMEIKKVLESTGRFMVERMEADQDPETGDVRMPFRVSMGEGVEPLMFGVKLEASKPLILFPENSRKALNNMMTQESKLLRAELMHIQETALDAINDVIEASLKRDAYLNEMHSRLSEVLGGMSLVEVSIVKNLVKERLKGVK